MRSLILRLLSGVLCIASVLAVPAGAAERVDLLITNAVIHDGRGNVPVNGAVAVRDGRVVATGLLADYSGAQEVDAQGLVVAPGFINMLSWAPETLLYDGRAVSDIKRG
jgi:N-acyl-D-amino-acid deacylase